jgi:hypothetical protein
MASRRWLGALLILAAVLCSEAAAQQKILLTCTTSSGAALMGSTRTQAYGVVGQSAIGLARGGGFEIEGGFLGDSLILQTIVGTEDRGEVPLAYELAQNYPNPFNPTTTIRYVLERRQRVTLTVYTVLGEVAATLVDGELPAGIYTVRWDATGVASGVYFYRLAAEEFTAAKKLLLVR